MSAVPCCWGEAVDFAGLRDRELFLLVLFLAILVFWVFLVFASACRGGDGYSRPAARMPSSALSSCVAFGPTFGRRIAVLGMVPLILHAALAMTA